METHSPDITLLALLLALKTLKDSLNQSTRDRLYEVGEQLELDPDDWDFIQQGLLAIIAENTSLNQQFQRTQQQLAALDGKVRNDLLPTHKELAEALKNRDEIERRGVGDESEDEASQKVVIVAQKLLKERDPMMSIKQPMWLERIAKFLKK